jgi:hypothetical protein
VSCPPAVTRADQATRDFIRIIVSTDVTSRPTPPRASFGHDVHRIPSRDVHFFVGATSLEWRGDVRRLGRTLA